MLIQLLILLLISFFGSFTSLFPVVTELPYIDSYLVQGIGYVRFLSDIFPPLGVILQAFLIYFTFLMTLKVIAFLPFIKHWLFKPK